MNDEVFPVVLCFRKHWTNIPGHMVADPWGSQSDQDRVYISDEDCKAHGCGFRDIILVRYLIPRLSVLADGKVEIVGVLPMTFPCSTYDPFNPRFNEVPDPKRYVGFHPERVQL